MPQRTIYASGYATVDHPGIQAYSFDDQTGELTPQGSFAGVVNPSFIVPHPEGRWLYAVSETGMAQDGVPGGVWALRITGEGTFEAINNLPSGGDWPCHLTIDATGRWLSATNYGSGTVAVFSIQENGA